MRGSAMSDFLWQSFITLLVIINPFAVVAMFMSLTTKYSAAEKRKAALKSIVISAFLLLLFAFVGDKLLDAMSISEPAFRIAGGFLLLLAAIEMVISHTTGLQAPTGDEIQEATHRADITVFPMAIPLIAGPGALTSIVILMRQAEAIGSLASVSVLSILIGVLLITYLVLLSGSGFMAILGATGTNVMTRIFGIILSSLAVQNIINGVSMIIRQFISA